MNDTRIVELEELAASEGLHLPMAASLIAYLESQGYVVDLHSGEVCRDDMVVGLLPSAQALCHLYDVDDDDISLIFAPAVEEASEFDLFDHEGELEDYQDDIDDRSFWSRGGW